MRLLIINPNSTDAMTHAIAGTATAAMPSAEITAWTSHKGPRAIEGPQDGEAAVPPLMDLIREASGFDAIIIACFDDTGLARAKATSPVPVIGIGEATYHAARLLGRRFSVITTLAVSVPVIEDNIRATGFSDLCARVRASDVPVLALENDPDASFKAIRLEAEQAMAEDNITALILGCAGMTGLQESLMDINATIIDGVRAAVHLATAAAFIAKVA